MGSLHQEWHVIASSEDLPFRHVYQTRLLGQELAVWRDDNGVVNVWENRCPHRGVRLSLGVNIGNQLKCQYHGWKYESGSGHCAFVPAHRTAKPSAACVRTFPCAEVDGLVFAQLEAPVGNAKPGRQRPLGAALSTNLRSHPVAMNAKAVVEAIQQAAPSFAPLLGDQADRVQTLVSGLSIDLSCAGLLDSVRIFVQPESDSKAVVHARLYAAAALPLQRKIVFTQLLDELFARVLQSPTPAPTARLIASDAVPLKTPNPPAADKPGEPFSCTVIARQNETPDIASFWLKPDDGRLLALEPGMHVSLTTPSGHLRQYSIVNTPDEQDVLVIGVKHEPQSRGGSRSMHVDVQVGTQVQLTLPRNQFQLQPPGRHALLIAGGIGVTPILAMGLHLQRAKRPYSFHYLARSEEHVAFTQRLAALGKQAATYLGLDTEGTQQTLRELLQDREPARHDVYVCGPQPMIDLVVELAREAGFASEQIHFEYFALAPSSKPPAAESGSYQVTIKSSGKAFTVSPGQTLLQACLDHGVTIDYSCEQGVCGACMTKVVSGELQHGDVYLSAKEKDSGTLIMPCVSGCRSETLILDI